MGQSPSNRGLSRFTEVNSAPDNAPLFNDYLNESIGSIEDSLKNLHSQISDLEGHINHAKKNCHYPNDHKLTRDEAAAVYLYTMEWTANTESLYSIFNRDLRTKDRSKMRVWLPFLKLLMVALDKLPSKRITIFRGLRTDVSKFYTEGKEFVWASATSCTRSINMACNFFANSNERCTMFRIDVMNGKDISALSHFKLEEEVLLRPGTRFRVTRGPAVENIDGKQIPVVHLKEI